MTSSSHKQDSGGVLEDRTFSKISLIKLLRIDIALDEIPVSG